MSTADLRDAGLDRDAVRRRVTAGHLHELFPGAYAVGHRCVTRDGWFLAATMSVGADSGLGFHSACQHYEIWDGRARKVHIVVPRRARHQPLIHIHSVHSPPEWEVVRGVRVVPPALAVLQLASVLTSVDAVRRVAREAQVTRLVTHEELLLVSDRARGAKRLRLALRGGAAPTRNGGEDRALALIRSCGLDPLVNEPLLGFVADFYLPEHGLVIEFDGRHVHDIPMVSLDDRRRQAVFEAAGLRVLRLDWHDLTKGRAQARRRILAATVTQRAHDAR